MKPPRGRIWLRVLTGVVLAPLILLAAIVGCMNLAPVRALLVERVNAALAGAFGGQLVIQRLGAIDPYGLSGVDAELFDPAGRRVVTARGVSVRTSSPRLLWSLLTRRTTQRYVHVSRLTVHELDTALIDDGTGTPTFVRAFDSRSPGPSTNPPPSLAIDALELHRGRIHGQLGGAPPLDLQLARASARLQSEGGGLTLLVEQLAVNSHGMPRGLDPEGTLQGSVVLAPGGSARQLYAKFSGRVARIPVEGSGGFDGDLLAVEVAIPAAPPERIEALLPALALRSTVTAVGEAHGRLDHPAYRVVVASDEGSLEVSGAAELGPTRATEALILARNVDLGGYFPAVRAMRVGGTLELGLRLIDSSTAQGHGHAVLFDSVVAGEPLPRTTLDAEFSVDPRQRRILAHGSASIEEPGAPTRVDFQIDSAKTTLASVHATSVLGRPPRLARWTGLAASGNVETRARVWVEQREVDAQVLARLTDVGRGANHLEHLAIDGKLAGKLTDPELRFTALADGNELGGQRFSRIRLVAQGQESRLHVTGRAEASAARRLSIDSVVALRPEPSVSHATLVLAQGETRVEAHLRDLRVRAGHVSLGRGELDGIGRAEVSLSAGRTLERLDLHTERLDVARLTELVLEQRTVKSARATLDGHYEAARGEPRGYLRGELDQLVFDRVTGGLARFDVSVERGKVTGAVAVNLDHTGQANLSMRDLELAEGLAPTLSEPGRFRGFAELTGKLDLAALERFWDRDRAPIQRARGSVAFHVRADGLKPAGDLPRVDAEVTTRALELVGRRASGAPAGSGAQARPLAPWRIQGVDVDLRVRLEVDGATEVGVHVADAQGPLASLDLQTRLPVRSLGTGPEFARALGDTPVEAYLTVPPRELEQLPITLPTAALRGRVDLNATLRGTIAHPQLAVAGNLARLGERGSRTIPLHIHFEGTHDRDRSELSLDTRVRGRQVGGAHLSWEGAPEDWLRGPAPLRGQVTAFLRDFPLESVPALRDQQIRGKANATVRLVGLGENAELSANLDAHSVRVGQADLDRIQASLRLGGGEFRAAAYLEAPDGTATFDLKSGLSWGARFAPSLVLPAEARASARHLRLAVLQPVVQRVLSEIDGRLDADVTGQFAADAVRLRGHAEVTDGALEVPSIGQHFSGVSARASLRDDEVRLDQLDAKGITGKLTAQGMARLRGLAVHTAAAKINVAQRDRLAVTVQGEQVGLAWGVIDVEYRASPAEEADIVLVTVPELHVDLPSVLAHPVQELEPAADVRVGVHQPNGGFVSLPLQRLPQESSLSPSRALLVDVKFGDKVWVRRDNQARVRLTGETRIRVAGSTSVRGQIRLRGGELDISGKKFRIERGTVTFDQPDPDNPTVVATARWDSPADYRVYATFVGPVRKGKLTLRSEPPLTQDQILSLLVFGAPEGSFGSSPQGSSASAAAGLAAGPAAEGLNRALSRITRLDVTTRVDTATGDARPELVVQLTPRIALEMSYAVAQPPPGQPPDRTFLTIDVRLLRRWSLLTSMGERGASMADLIWRHNY